MAETNNEIVEVKDEKNSNVFLSNLSVIATPEGFQKFILGTKKNGQYRAIYDVVKDCTAPKKKKKKKKKNSYKRPTSVYDVYLTGKKKKKKKHKKNKPWRID